MDSRKYALPTRYLGPATDDVKGELRRVATALESICNLLPQAADRAPSDPRAGMVRYALYPAWAPLGGSSNVWVYYNGTAWVAL